VIRREIDRPDTQIDFAGLGSRFTESQAWMGKTGAEVPGGETR